MDKYYILENSEGDIYFREYTPEELQDYLDELVENEEEITWLDKVVDMNYTEQPILIKGRIVVPKAVEIVKRYEVE